MQSSLLCIISLWMKKKKNTNKSPQYPFSHFAFRLSVLSFIISVGKPVELVSDSLELI